jgi:hypothetical protein
MRAIHAFCLMALAGCAQPPPFPGTFDYSPFVERRIAEGFYRSDRNPADLPVTDAALIRNFLTIAFRREGLGDQSARDIPLWRWTGPIRFSVEGNRATRADRAAIAAFFDRLSALTGVPVAEDAEDPNYRIFILDLPGRRETGASLRREGGRWTSAGEFVGRMDDWSIPCRGTGRRGRDNRIEQVAVLIKAETAGPLRRSCIEEELAQGMGLINDDDRVRPSIFNDRNEFGVLTDHDAMLLRMLYHPLLRPGMTAEDARPLLPRVLADIRARMAREGMS